MAMMAKRKAIESYGTKSLETETSLLKTLLFRVKHGTEESSTKSI